jgi:hypothetical protein
LLALQVTRRFVAALVAPLLVGCAGKSSPKVAPDLARSQKLADALQVGMGSMKLVPSSWDMKYSLEAAQEGVGGSAIVLFVVMPNGRVDRESRTLVFVEGHTIFAKNICDALLAAKWEPAPTDQRGRIGVFPVFFASGQGKPPRDSARAAFTRASSALGPRLKGMTFDEALAWFQARPSCSKIKIGIEPLFGGPPT